MTENSWHVYMLLKFMLNNAVAEESEVCLYSHDKHLASLMHRNSEEISDLNDS